MTGIVFSIFISIAGASEAAKQDLLKAYSEEVASYGAKLSIEYQYDNRSRAAYTTRKGNIWRIVIGGAYLNKKDDGALRILLCHELGHHIGGAPYKFIGSGEHSWISAEGQADYFAGAECAKKLIHNEAHYIDSAEIFAQQMWSKNRKKDGPKPNRNQTSEIIARSTLLKHPQPQCRLDTYIAAYYCPEDKDCRPPCWFKPSD